LKSSYLRWSITAAKVIVAGGLIYWMVDSDKLHFSDLKILRDEPRLLISAVSIWILTSVFLCSFRWMTLLRGLDLQITFKRAAELNLIGAFFNTVMPGAVGGDIIKAAYVIRDQQSRKTPAMMTIVLDRVVGLMGLFTLGAVAVLLNIQVFWANPLLRPVVLLVFGALLAMMVIFAMGVLPLDEKRDPIMKMLRLNFPGANFLSKIYGSLRSYQNKPSALVIALLVSILTQSCNLFYFIFLTSLYTGQSFSWISFASIFPVGILTTALPLAPGGLGVGHVAFEKLYELIGLSGGANCFNIFLLGQMTLNLTGIIPYLMIGAKKPYQAQSPVQTSSYSDI